MRNNYVRSSSDPYTPPDYFLRFLRGFAPDCRLRWSQRFDRWELERHVSHAVQYITSLPQYVRRADRAMVENDSWIRARDGYILVRVFSPLPHLGEGTIRQLRWGDPWRMGGAQRMAEAMLEQEMLQARIQRNDFNNHIESIAKEQFQEMIWDGGERVAVPKNYKVTHGNR